MSKNRKKKKSLSRIAIVAFILITALVGSILISRSLVLRAAAGRTWSDPDSIPANHTALVLGCIPRIPGRGPNLYFLARMDAAAELFLTGKVRYLLVSGDNHIKGYNEPEAMKTALIDRGVPEERIVCDYAGLRTLDSVVRAKEIFGQNRITIVSQEFHNQRALFIARARGIDAVGYNARGVSGPVSWKTTLREHLARAKAVLDVYILNKQPRHLGQPIPIGENNEENQL